MKKTLLILFAAWIAWPASGQSTSIFNTADSLLLRQYLKNTAAIRDSLIRFEYTKLRLTSSQTDFLSVSTRYAQLQGEYSKITGTLASAQASEQSCRADLQDTKAQAEKRKKKLRAANLEKWCWRIATGAAVLVVIKTSHIP